MAHISERESELPDAMIGKLLKLAVEDKSIISLGLGEPDFGMPKPLVDYAKKLTGKCNHYSPPEGRKELREAVARKLRKENKIKTSPENVIITSGSQEALFLATACSLDVGENILIPDPSFLGYMPCVELLDVSPAQIELKEGNGWEIDPDDVRKKIDAKKTKALIINTPANPTGNIIRKKTLEEIAQIAVEHDLYVFSDEAYEKIIYGKRHVSIASLSGMEEHAVTFQSFSKSYAMCGFRIGYCAGPSELIAAMTKSHVYTTLCAPTLSQMLALRALSLNKIYVEKMVREYKRRRDFIVNRLNEIGLPTVMPEGAFYAFSRIPENNSLKFSFRLLKKAKIGAVPGSEFGRCGEGYVRFSYATEIKRIETAMERLGKFMKKNY
jgi:aminotransferase